LLILMMIFGASVPAFALVPVQQSIGSDVGIYAQQVRIICEPNGFCYRAGRHRVARWIYGDDVFTGPYVGPAYYGWPGHHHIWWPFGY
jgi:hypothetical protein